MIFALPREKKKHALFNIARLLRNLALQRFWRGGGGGGGVSFIDGDRKLDFSP